MPPHDPSNRHSGTETGLPRVPTGLPSRVLLASASPRRRELLMQIAVTPVVVPAHIDEGAIRHHDPIRLSVDLARAKASAVIEKLGVEPEPYAEPVSMPLLAADTVVAVAGEILEKPADRDDARRMIELLSGHTHQVVTGIAVVDGVAERAAGDSSVAEPFGWRPIPHAHLATRYSESHVTFAELTSEEVGEYTETDDWQDVAGAYRIQGLAARYITRLSGSYSNVVGLPLHLVYSILTR